MERGNEHKPEDLWEWPRWMVSAILAVHDRAELLVAGLTRRAATRLTRWLWAAEVIVRRLLLALALKLPLRQLARREHTPAEATPPEASHPAKPRSSFHAFAFRSLPSGAATAPPAHAHKPSLAIRPGFGVLPRDPLLSLGAAGQPRRKSKRSATSPRSYGPPPVIQTEEDYERALLGRVSALERLPASAARPDIHGVGRGRRTQFNFPLPGPFDDETLRPAPGLAARINALLRVIEDPVSAAWRLTSLLARRAGAARDLAAAEPPWFFGKPRYGQQPPPGLEERLLAHRALAAMCADFNDSS